MSVLSHGLQALWVKLVPRLQTPPLNILLLFPSSVAMDPLTLLGPAPKPPTVICLQQQFLVLVRNPSKLLFGVSCSNMCSACNEIQQFAMI